MEYKLHASRKHATFVVKAYSNTWSHQRRKRREQERLKSDTSESENVNITEEHEIVNVMNDMKVHSPPNPNKRDLEEDDSMEEYYDAKRFCTENGIKPYLEFMIKVYEEGQFLLELYLLNECKDKDSLNQILQYVKNNLKL